MTTCLLRVDGKMYFGSALLNSKTDRYNAEIGKKNAFKRACEMRIHDRLTAYPHLTLAYEKIYRKAWLGVVMPAFLKAEFPKPPEPTEDQINAELYLGDKQCEGGEYVGEVFDCPAYYYTGIDLDAVVPE